MEGMGNHTKAKWILRLEGGALRGPYDTAAILEMIREGQFNGNELIARYPDGQWTFISREPEFYDSMLDALEGAVRASDPKVQKISAEETIFMPPPPSAESVLQPAPKPAPIQIDSSKPLAPVPAAQLPKPPTEHQTSSVIELADIGKMEKDHVTRNSRIPLVILGLLIIAAAAYFMVPTSTESTSDKISLVAPGVGKTVFSDAEIKKRYAVATTHILRDTFEDYFEAQNKLVALVEGTPTQHSHELAIRGALCMVYKELWPYAKQDAQDIKVVTLFTQATRARNVISGYGNFCEIVKLLTTGRLREARGSVDILLENNQDETFTMKPILYGIKAELLENEKDFQFAAAYYEKAAQDITTWLKPKSRLGFLHLATRDYKKASEWFRQVVRVNPRHKASKVGLAFTEYYGFRQYESAFNLLSTGLAEGGRIPRLLESEAYQVLAELLIERNDKSGALDAAHKSYRLNPNNDIARQLVLRLGGSDKISKEDRSQNSELMFLGDQYVRQGDCLAAQAEFKAAYDLDKTNGVAAMKAGRCLWQLNQSYEAVEWLNKAVRADPKLITAYVLKSDYLSQRFDFAGAAQALSTAARMIPNNYEVLRGMALLELRKGNMTGAINLGHRALKIYDADIETYIILSKANLALAQSIQSSLKKEIERRENAFKDAVRYADRAVEIDSTSSEAQIAYADMRAVTYGTDNAVEYLRDLIRKFSYSSEYKIALADVYKRSERWSDARNVYQQVVEVDPRNKKAWLGLGESMRAMGEIESALKAFLNAAVIDPMDGEALFQAGKLYYESGRFDEALKQFLRVKNMNPHFPRTNYYAGKAAFAQARYKEALQFARDEKRLNPSLADPYILMAEVYDAQMAFGECATEYSAAIKLRPGGAEIYVKAARCYRQAGALDIAETMLALAKDRESGYAGIYRELGALFERRGDFRAARVAYMNYLELAPNAPDRRDVEGRVERMGGR